MRILQISSSNSFGGGEKHLLDLSRGLSESGCDVHVAVRPKPKWIYRFAFLGEEHVHRVPLLNAADLWSAVRLSRIIAKKNIEIVHAHMARDYPVAALAVRLSRSARLVLTRHVMFPLKNVHKLLLNNAAAVIGVSEAAAGSLRNVFPKSKVYRVYNGLEPSTSEDPERTRREFRFEHNISYDDTVITSVGAVTRLKGHSDLIAAASRVLSVHPEAFFLFIGKDEAAGKIYSRELKTQAENMGIKERVLFRDWVDEIAPLMAATDIFVSPSHTESFGLAILEAMAYGKPVVATSTDGAKELVSDGEDGILVPVRKPDELADAVIKLIDDPDMCKKLSRNAKHTAAERFSLGRMIRETKAVYEEVLNK